MPQIFRVGSFIIYFWSDENNPLEPVHVHIAEGNPGKDGTKIWITQAGKTIVAHNKSDIPVRELRKLQRIIESNVDIIVQKWYEHFEGELRYFC